MSCKHRQGKEALSTAPEAACHEVFVPGNALGFRTAGSWSGFSTRLLLQSRSSCLTAPRALKFKEAECLNRAMKVSQS